MHRRTLVFIFEPCFQERHHVESAEMPARMDDVMRLCCEVSAHEEIKVAVKNSTKGAMVAGGSAFVGGLLGGPPGIAVGK